MHLGIINYHKCKNFSIIEQKILIFFVDYLHVAGVPEAHAALGGALVAAVLKVDDAFAGLHLLFAELPHVLRRFFWSDAGNSEIGALRNEYLSRIFGKKLYCYS